MTSGSGTRGSMGDYQSVRMECDKRQGRDWKLRNLNPSFDCPRLPSTESSQAQLAKPRSILRFQYLNMSGPTRAALAPQSELGSHEAECVFPPERLREDRRAIANRRRRGSPTRGLQPRWLGSGRPRG